MPRSAIQEGLTQAQVGGTRYVRPVEDRGPNEIAIQGSECVCDSRVQPEVVLSAGNPHPPAYRDASLRIGNQVVVLDPTGQNTLAIALLAINRVSNRQRDDVIRFGVPTTTTP